MKAILYARSARANDAVIRDQIGILTKYAAANDMDITAELIDRGVSGLANGKTFDALVQFAHAGEFDVLLAVSPDRLSRDGLRYARLCRQLAKSGVRVIHPDQTEDAAAQLDQFRALVDL